MLMVAALALTSCGENGSESSSLNDKLSTLYKLVQNRDRQAAIEIFRTINPDQLTSLEAKLLEDTIKDFKAELSTQHYLEGLDQLKNEDYTTAIKSFRASLKLNNNAVHATAVKIHMANATRLLGNPQEAIALLQQLITAHTDRTLSDDAHWYLALSHFEAQQHDQAGTVLKNLMKRFPDSQYFRPARIRVEELNRAHNSSTI